ncbi:MAG: alpha/beta fold hydrolase [Mycobacteriales bacterium]
MSGKRTAGIIGAAIGGVAALTAVGVAVEKYAIGRIHTGEDRFAGEPFGELPVDRTCTVVAMDGVPLHVAEIGPRNAPLTVVLVHGFALSLESWHFQILALAEVPGVRLVLYDQRGHGRSGRGPAAHATITQLGADLGMVIDTVAGTGRLVLIGHSMGGMAILGLAQQRPDFFASRVGGLGLVATSAGRLATGLLGAAVARSVRQMHYVAGAGLRRTPAALVERTRKAGADIAWMLTRRYGFGSTDASPSLVGFADRMIGATPVDVIGELLPEFGDRDQHGALPALDAVPTRIVVGERDLLTPPSHSQDIADSLPDAKLTVVKGAGHLVMLEQPDRVTGALRDLVTAAVRRPRERRR